MINYVIDFNLNLLLKLFFLFIIITFQLKFIYFFGLKLKFIIKQL